MNLRLSLLVGTCVYILCSCAVGKKYKRQDMGIPGAYRTKVAVTGDTIQMPWKTFFKDQQLVALIEKALVKNNEVNIALKNMDQLELAYKQAKQALLPSLDLNIGASRAWPSKNSLNGSLTEQFLGTPYIDDYAATARLSWEADIWGKVKMQKEAARANYFAQKQNLSAVKTRIISQVAMAYYSLVSLDEQLVIAKQNINLSDSTLTMMQLQYKAGLVTSLATKQIEAQKVTAQLLLPLARKNIAIQENALSILCGVYPDSIVRASTLEAVLLPDSLANAVPVQLLSRRPDVRAAEYAVMVNNARTGLAKAAMYPSLSLTPQIGLNSFKMNSWFSLPGSLTKTLAVNLTQPLFQRRALKTAYQTALLEQEKSNLQFKQFLLVAVAEVSDAMSKVNHANERLLLVKQKSTLLDHAAKDATLLYKSGMANYLEVLTAQNNKLQNDLDAINIKLEKYNAMTELYKALGGGEH